MIASKHSTTSLTDPLNQFRRTCQRGIKASLGKLPKSFNDLLVEIALFTTNKFHTAGKVMKTLRKMLSGQLTPHRGLGVSQHGSRFDAIRLRHPPGHYHRPELYLQVWRAHAQHQTLLARICLSREVRSRDSRHGSSRCRREQPHDDACGVDTLRAVVQKYGHLAPLLVSYLGHQPERLAAEPLPIHRGQCLLFRTKHRG